MTHNPDNNHIEDYPDFFDWVLGEEFEYEEIPQIKDRLSFQQELESDEN